MLIEFRFCLVYFHRNLDSVSNPALINKKEEKAKNLFVQRATAGERAPRGKAYQLVRDDLQSKLANLFTFP